MLRGLTTITYYADDLPAAVRWYSELLGVEPYLHRPELGYVEFRLGDYQHELGIRERQYAPGTAEDFARPSVGPVTYWHVDDVATVVQRMLDRGAAVHQPPQDVGQGFIRGSVVDPFGNVVGVMYNPHYLDVLRGSDAHS